jgi:hypothetical protein
MLLCAFEKQAPLLGQDFFIGLLCTRTNTRHERSTRVDVERHGRAREGYMMHTIRVASPRRQCRTSRPGSTTRCLGGGGLHDGAHSGRPNTVWHIWEARGDGGRPHRQSSKYGLACLGGLRGWGRPHRQSSKNCLACLGAGGVWGGRIGSHPNTVWHVWEACGVWGARIGSHPTTV